MSFDYYKVIKELKSKPCTDCGKTFDPVCMDFDHRPGEVKVGQVSQFRHNEAAFYAEVAKCDLVCACCHRLRGKNRGFSEAHRQNLRKAKYAGFGAVLQKARKGVKRSEETRLKMLAEGKHLGRPQTAERVERSCGNCGAKLTFASYDPRLQRDRVYCNKTCMKIHRRTPGWKNA